MPVQMSRDNVATWELKMEEAKRDMIKAWKDVESHGGISGGRMASISLKNAAKKLEDLAKTLREFAGPF